MNAEWLEAENDSDLTAQGLEVYKGRQPAYRCGTHWVGVAKLRSASVILQWVRSLCQTPVVLSWR